MNNQICAWFHFSWPNPTRPTESSTQADSSVITTVLTQTVVISQMTCPIDKLYLQNLDTIRPVGLCKSCDSNIPDATHRRGRPVPCATLRWIVCITADVVRHLQFAAILYRHSHTFKERLLTSSQFDWRVYHKATKPLTGSTLIGLFFVSEQNKWLTPVVLTIIA